MSEFLRAWGEVGGVLVSSVGFGRWLVRRRRDKARAAANETGAAA